MCKNLVLSSKHKSSKLTLLLVDLYLQEAETALSIRLY